MQPQRNLELEKGRLAAIRACKEDIEEILSLGRELMTSLFPEAKITPGEGKSFDAHKVVDYKLNKIRAWVTQVLNDGLTLAAATEPIEIFPETIRLPHAVAEEVLETLVVIFTHGRDLADNDYYYISDLANAIGLEVPAVSKVIEQTQYEIRKAFFSGLLAELDDQQCFNCAVLLMKAIQADEELHPAEFKYVENIAQLLENDQSRIEEVERFCSERDELPRVFLPEDIAAYMYKYLAEIVMCGGDYDSRETAFIKEVGEAFGFDHHRQDEIIQPVAAALMTKAALFPKN
ncbi:MAG: hypothetical protein RRB13_09305 [bacterium]|nr:hypothetical protein [bacterium]